MSEQNSVVGDFKWSSLRATAEARLEGNKEVTPPSVKVPSAETTATASDVADVKTVEHNVGTGQVTKTNQTEQPSKETKTEGDKPSGTPIVISDDALVEWTVDGETRILPYKEAKAMGIRHATWTKRTQALSAKEDALAAREAEIATLKEEHTQLSTLVGDKRLLADYVKEVLPELTAAERKEVVKEVQAAQQPDGTFDPDEIATLGQAKQLIERLTADKDRKISELQAKLSETEKSIDEKLDKRIQKFNEDADRAKSVQAINTLIDSTIDAMVKDIPLLKGIPHVKDAIRKDLAKLKSKNVEELKENLATVAKGYVEEIEDAVTTTNKTKVTQKEKLVTRTIQPSGGSPVTPTPINAKDVKTAEGGIDWKKLRELAANR